MAKYIFKKHKVINNNAYWWERFSKHWKQYEFMAVEVETQSSGILTVANWGVFGGVEKTLISYERLILKDNII